MTPQQEFNLDEALLRLADGQLSEDGFRQLSDMLRSDDEALENYIEQMAYQSLLKLELASADELPGIVIEGRPQQGRRWQVWAGLATAATLLISWMLLGNRPTAADNNGLAKVVRVSQATNADGKPVEAGEVVSANPFELTAGYVELETLSGVRLVLEGPARLKLSADQLLHVLLESGKLVATVPPSAIGFTVETAEARVIDLGTEFGVRADKESGTSVQVYSGEVITKPKSQSAQGRLVGGQAVHIPSGATQPEAIEFFPERFVRYLPDPWDPNHPGDEGRRKVSPYNEVHFDAVHIVPAPGQVTVDGSLAEWDLSGQFEVHCEPPYGDFYHVKAAMMYDQTHLYLSAVVGDPFPMRSVFSPHVDHKLHGTGGSVALRLSVDRAMGWPVHGEAQGVQTPFHVLTDADRNDKLVFLVLWHYAAEDLACLDVRYGMDRHGKRTNPDGYQGKYVKHADSLGYTMEYAIPWSLLSAADDPPQGGDTLGCTWLVHWAGPEGRTWKGQLIDVVNPDESGWHFVRAATWGKAVYHAQGNLPPETIKRIKSYSGSRVQGNVR